jgi:hypothetical protein
MSRKLLLLSAAVALALHALAQVSTSRITGTVLDSSGAAVPGAKVNIRNEATGASFNTESAANGAYFVDALATGTYTVQVEASGFKKFLSKGNELTIGQPATVNITLEVGSTAETVEVSDRAELVQTSTSGNLGNQLSERVIKDLPIVGTRGRNPLDLVLTQPGVVAGANTGGGVIVNGARDRAWNFTIDGIDANETSAGGSNFAPVRMNPDSLAEFRIVTSNPTAEFGRNSGANVTMVTRSGTNKLSGTAFWFYRTPELNANEWENNFNSTPTNVVGKRQFVQNIFGGSIGGPVRLPGYDGRNRTFWFLNIQRLAATETRTVNQTVYTSQARQGNWRYAIGRRNGPFGNPNAVVDFAGNVLPDVNLGTYNVGQNDPARIGIDRTIAAALANTPLPNNFEVGDGLNTAGFRWTPTQLERQQDNTLRFDHAINDKNTLFARFAWGFQNTNCDAGNGGLELFPGTGCVVNTVRNPYNMALNWRTNPTSRLTNELIVGRNYFGFDFQVPPASIDSVAWSGAPVTLVESSFVGNARFLNTWQVVDNASYQLGAHAIKFGVNLRLASHRDQRGSIAGESATQGVSFSRTLLAVDANLFSLPAAINQQFDRITLESNINFLLGRVARTARGFSSDGQKYVAGLYDFVAKYNEYDFYVQDTWKVAKGLTIDAGLRYEAKLTPSEANGRVRRPDQAMVFGAPPTSSVRWVQGDLYRSDWDNWAPSLGIAWDPFGKGQTVIRTNYRIAYDRINTFVLSSSVFQNLPGIAIATENLDFGRNGGRLANLPRLEAPNVDPNSLSQPAPFSNLSITVVDPSFKTPTTHMWSFGLQQQLPWRFVFSADYLGRRAYNLIGAYNANQVDIFRTGFLDAYNVARGGGESALLNNITQGDTRRRTGESGAAFLRRQFATEITQGAVSSIAGQLATQAPGANFFRRFPQFGTVNVIDSNDFSSYHSLQLQMERRFYKGLAYQFSYTWAKALDTRSFDPTFTVVSAGSVQSASSTPFDISNRRLNFARGDSDYRHAFQGYWVAELPFGRGRRFNLPKALDYVAGGWQVAGFFRRYSGRPFTVYSGINTFGNIQSSTANCSGCRPDDGTLFVETQGTSGQNGFMWYFPQNLRAKFTVPDPGLQGNTPRNFFETAWRTNIDMSLSKRIYYWGDNQERNLELRADSINVTNTPTWDIPTANLQSALFGRLGTPNSNNSRKIQLALRLHF